MRILITGATGFIGVNLVRNMRKWDHEPIAMVRESSPVEFLPPDVSTVTGDVTDLDRIKSIIHDESIDGIVHLATVSGGSITTSTQGGLNPEVVTQVNIEGSQNVCDAAEAGDVNNLIFLSTIKAHPQVPNEEDSLYIDSKIEAEDIIKSDSYSFNYCIIHPTIVSGSYDYRLSYYQPYQLVNSNRLLLPPMYMPRLVNFVHVDDVTATIKQGLGEDSNNRFLVSGENIKYKTYHRHIANVVDGSCIVLSVPFYRQILPKVIDAGNRMGILPVSSETFNWEKSSGIPSRFENQSPGPQKPITTIVQDTHDWYEKVGLL